MDLAPHHATLRHLTRTDPDPRVRHRADGLLLVAGGMSVTKAAQSFGCARNSLRTWSQRFLAEGRDGLADRGRRGCPPKLDAAARTLLETALTESPLDYDYPVTTWTVVDLTDLLDRRGWSVSTATVYRGPGGDGLSLPAPSSRPHTPAGCRGRRLRQARLGRTPKKGASAECGFRLVYVDECDLHTHPHLAKTWQRRGRPVSIPAAGKDQRRAVFGALDSASGHVAWHLQEHKDGVGFAHFLDRIAQTWPGDDLVLVMDNVSYHRTAAMRAWWAAQNGRIVPFWLPAYAPNLNLIERVWRFLKQKLACHRFWADVAGLEMAAGTLLGHIEAHFHTDDRPAIRLVKDFCQSA